MDDVGRWYIFSSVKCEVLVLSWYILSIIHQLSLPHSKQILIERFVRQDS